MATHRLPNRRSRRPLYLALAAGLIIAAWIGCHNGSRDAGALTSAGVTHLQMREYERAIRDFDRALALEPGLVVAWRARAQGYDGWVSIEEASRSGLDAFREAVTYVRGAWERAAP